FVFITHTLIYSIYTLSLHDALPIFYRTRSIGKYPTTIAIQIGYANGGGIKKQYTDKNGYQTANKIAEKLWEYIYSNGDHEALYRTISVNFTNFKDSNVQQLELFKPEKEIKEEMIHHAMDKIKLKYGRNVIMRAESLNDASTLKKDGKLMAGHKA